MNSTVENQKAKYHRKNQLHVFDGFVGGEVRRDELRGLWVDFTTESGVRFGAVLLEDVEMVATSKVLIGTSDGTIREIEDRDAADEADLSAEESALVVAGAGDLELSEIANCAARHSGKYTAPQDGEITHTTTVVPIPLSQSRTSHDL